MSSSKHGKPTSTLPEVSVEGITPRGVWLHVRGREYFLGYADFPWFREAKLSEIQHVKLVRNSCLRWPSLDVDLELDSLDHPQRYPLVYRR